MPTISTDIQRTSRRSQVVVAWLRTTAELGAKSVQEFVQECGLFCSSSDICGLFFSMFAQKFRQPHFWATEKCAVRRLFQILFVVIECAGIITAGLYDAPNFAL